MRRVLPVLTASLLVTTTLVFGPPTATGTAAGTGTEQIHPPTCC